MHTASKEIQQNVCNNDIKCKCTVHSENHKVLCTICLHTETQWLLVISCCSNNNGEQAGQSLHKMSSIIPLQCININNVLKRLHLFQFSKLLSCCAHRFIMWAKENTSKDQWHIFMFVQMLSCICCMTAIGFQWRTQEFCLGGGVNKFSWGQRAEIMGIWRQLAPSQGFCSICKWMKSVFLLGCYRCTFHRSGNLA
jgi:hypothetical protein